MISLPDCTVRRKKISSCLDSLSLPFEFIDGVDGRNGLPIEFEQLIDREGMTRSYRQVMNDADLGCALSHIKTYRMMVDRDLDWSLILEDDAVVLEPAVEYLNDGHYRMADITQLGYFRSYIRDGSRRPLFGQFSAFPKITEAPGAFGYVISRRLAEYWSTRLVPVHREADWPKCSKDFVWDVVHPCLVMHPEHTEGQSIIWTASRERRQKHFLEKVGMHPRTWASAWVKLTSRRIP
ncbi:MAG: glycosyltransferase family 25 protein [Paracoccaceae bacterium]|nr:glycosyltransferase family 25 protein [Paracoccaceae bacterium]